MSGKKEIAIEYFKALRSEIDLRLKNHAYLTISKIVACSSLLGLFVSNELWWAAIICISILSFALDLSIYHNISSVNSIGRYIRDELEKNIFSQLSNNEWMFYEHKAQSAKRGSIDFILDRLGQLIVTGIFIGASIFFVHGKIEIHCYFYALLIVLFVLNLKLALSSTAKD